ncbi:putative Glycosyl transferase family 1 domain-containing protein [Vibrio crassostreae]|uniref:glycosyltransferase family 4 protein n=1 Tax=Vibrio crassostreae TaxID=246167 RepID=UPI001B30BCBC|nr:glycosyltransferase family 4 protein [Vibrio crassostreae]CAK1935004.1 putative Glycosyl transferase family 1 domain-containing protein [Vibrio crassostreae]CAK1940300.1 putative Glycosyl transferase family 1 domain-containing protein [Vibrio crassostreae]CAK1940900.1 putative Glycosyl transferase family 1 domain-containing protein [Vibrio crassostreae]CAK1945103.1 putative Glycosyl transferase family 1 domain-containing protein [Vibrio crassostreae]CAK1946126.1 putative Glycosyl transferas
MRYITSVNIPAVNAQSAQINANSLAFSSTFDEFELVSPRNNKNDNLKKEFNWNKVNVWFKSGRLKYLEFCLKALWLCNDNKVVYTRDILIAFLFLYFRKGTVVYEAHQRPSRVAMLCIRLLRNHEDFKVVTISYALKNFYIGYFGIDERKVLVAHDGINVDIYNKMEKINLHKKFSIDKNYKILLHTGSLYPGRGAELFGPILNKYPDLVILHIGGSQEIIDDWKRKISSDRFNAHSHVPSNELVSCQISADYLLYPMLRSTKTYWCCSPMKMFEYMATNVPIISTDIGSIKEVLNDENSFTFDPDDVDTLWNAIDLALGSTEICKERSTQALIDVKSCYTWQLRADRIRRFVLK